MKDIDFWFEFASTYSYLAAMRAQGLAADCGVRLTWRPFLLGAIFKKDLGYADSPFNRHDKKGDYMWRDMDRQVRIHGLPSVKKPEPFPQNGLTAARIAMVLEEDDRLPIFVRSVFRAQFQYGETISEPDVLFDILSQNGFDAPDVMQRAKSDKIKQALKTQTEHADRIGIFGAPSFVTPKGELFWGDDRMETAFRWQD
ncbi:2-hydroxychromene-2-carboxylate isomerase [Cohaesibacter gelatinilyticus]|uniref:2-hydroxychromene-2-carboxylate isomerase n=1 Tax=Cohaesibacter gelatinilyticus TaxID=372072 RepID=A0A285NCT1_9HYPH|nr:2-hydroxychromene-2-carboxylate isomerase [Cohaesibacter gelatinilyticus]SNZ07275.1 2-hydroxychromene-2-carboxylate isomerase [Cohaesibacter gelatinilyticus]